MNAIGGKAGVWGGADMTFMLRYMGLEERLSRPPHNMWKETLNSGKDAGKSGWQEQAERFTGPRRKNY